jgi:hypothetical protein
MEINENIQKEIFALKENFPNQISFEFHDSAGYDRVHDKHLQTSVNRFGSHVKVNLVRPSTLEEAEQWGDALARAGALLDQIQKEAQHEMNHPDSFKALKFKYDYLHLKG